MAQKTVLFSTFGARGDVWPYLAVAREVQQRGHHAIIASSEGYRAEIERLGLEFRDAAPPLPRPEQWEAVMHPVGGVKTLIEEHLLPTLRADVETLRAASQGADMLVSHTLSLAAPLVAELEKAKGLKWVSAAVSPVALFDATATLRRAAWAARFPAINGAIFQFLARECGRLTAPVEEVRRELGLPGGQNALAIDAHSPLLKLGLWPRFFAPVSDTSRLLTGFCDLEDKTALPPDIDHFLRSGSTPLIFVCGSFLNDANNWREVGLEAARILKRRALFLGSSPFESAEAMGRPFAPLAAVLEKVGDQSALITHGGIGTLALGMKAGIPMLVIPHAFDQFDGAIRAQKLRVARVLDEKRFDAATLAREITTLWNGKPANLQIQAELRQNHGAKIAAEAILAV